VQGSSADPKVPLSLARLQAAARSGQEFWCLLSGKPGKFGGNDIHPFYALAYDQSMGIQLIIAGFLGVMLLIYLVYSIIRPGKF
jgi:K+-transporting ATPase KdpF subunit